jgi:hypothetical protein
LLQDWLAAPVMVKDGKLTGAWFQGGGDFPLVFERQHRHHQTSNIKLKRMKKLFIPIMAVVSAMFLLTGCAVELGGGSKTKTIDQKPTIGQQLIDLKKAMDTGAITDSEYQAQKAKVLEGK